ncbi:GTP-dependent nucleic acid-binding protein engD [Phytophthora cinnamomi]|uniref:GTP-dependent nucleic acid-binding protein engD n=1 Tax=Phytophthora cinnamomi TaxID=4785 RepID=UPI0035597D9B|nr:GTP-dependent nucleic acid-binding protein engD [Phytophthora cinnamomi]
MSVASHPRHAAFSPAQVTGFYFRPCRDDRDEVILEYYRCRCGTVRKQTRRNGYSDLMQHVRREHPDYQEVMLSASTAETGSMLNYVRRSALNVFGWLDWIQKNNLPLTFCENRAARRYSNLDPICVETLVHAMNSLTRVVERSIAAEVPDRFGLIFDGWTHASEHFIAVFACYEVKGARKTPLLCMAPLLNALEEDLSARGHMEFLANMLPRDFATLMGVPLVGCASHRLNLAVQADMEQFSADLDLVQSLILKLRTLTQSAKLRYTNSDVYLLLGKNC